MKQTVSVLLLFAALVPGAHAQLPGSALTAKQLQGRQIFAQSCGVCHLQPSLGVKTYGPMLNKTSAAANDEVMRIVVANGGDHMPGFKYYLKPAEIDAIIAYVRTIPVPVIQASGETQK